MAAQNRYPRIVPLQFVANWFVLENDPEWMHNMTLEWLRVLKGWTKSDDFQQQVVQHGLTQDNIASIMHCMDITIHNAGINIGADPENRFSRLAWRYYRHQHGTA
jgi:hypothetical protein